MVEEEKKQADAELAASLTTPTLTWMDIEKCDKILRTLQAVEQE